MKTRKISKVYATLANWRKFQFRLFGEGIVVGACSGLIIVGFRYALEVAESLRSAAYSRLSAGDWLPVGLWFLLLFFIAFILHRIVAIEPMSAGSGIPQVKGTILGVMRRIGSWACRLASFSIVFRAWSSWCICGLAWANRRRLVC